MNKRYQVVFLGLIKSEDSFREGMVRLGAPLSTLKQIIKKAPVILKKDMRIADARKYADAIQDAGGNVSIRAHGYFEESAEKKAGSIKIKPLENFIMCPQCGYKQLKAETCVKCGIVLVKETEETSG